VGVISMRDLFRTAMERLDFNLDKVFQSEGAPSARSSRKLVGVFSADRALRELVDKSAQLTDHLLVKALQLKDDFESLDKYFAKFEVLVIDVDGMAELGLKKFLAFAKSRARKPVIHVVFSPMLLKPQFLEPLHRLSDQRTIHLMAKPVALGLFFEQMIKEL